MKYEITHNAPTGQESSARDTAALALKVALNLEAEGHDDINIFNPAGSRLTVKELAELVREGIERA